MFENIKSDFLRYYTRGPSLRNAIRIILSHNGFYATVIYRFGRWSNIVFAGRSLFFIRYFLLAIHYCLHHLVIKMYRIDIDLKAIIGKGLYIPHFVGIEIRPCEIGEFCSIYQHVKIGSAEIIESGKFPHIGSRVWIGPYARITGNVIVGENSTVSAGTLVIKDISAGSLVTGIPTRVISSSYDNRAILYLN